MILGVYKPPGITSHDVVDFVRQITKEQKVGHGGTLDPFAEGVLVIGITRDATKKLHEVLKNTDKEYVATLELGKASTTDDPEGIITETKNAKPADVTREEIEKTLQRFTGKIEQTPPQHSAVKIKGKPAYALARKGKDIEMPKRLVTVSELELLEFEPPRVTIRAVVSSGTYIRSLARDIGRSLGAGAYLTRLVRTRVGDFTLENCVSFDKLENALNPHT